MIENYRIHQCEIRYFLDDGTIEVIEPKTFDPGFPQGRIIRRHKIPYPRPAHNATYSLEDLDVGCQVTFYGKTFFISGVDDATRVHLNRKEGRQVLANLEMPEDLYTNWRKDVSWKIVLKEFAKNCKFRYTLYISICVIVFQFVQFLWMFLSNCKNCAEICNNSANLIQFVQLYFNLCNSISSFSILFQFVLLFQFAKFDHLFSHFF